MITADDAFVTSVGVDPKFYKKLDWEIKMAAHEGYTSIEIKYKRKNGSLTMFEIGDINIHKVLNTLAKFGYNVKMINEDENQNGKLLIEWNRKI